MVMVMPLAPPCMCQPETVSDHHHYDYDDHDDDCDEMLLALPPSYFCRRNITKTFSLFTNLFLSQALLPDNISSWHLTTSLVGNPNHLWTTLKMMMMMMMVVTGSHKVGKWGIPEKSTKNVT